MTEPNRSLLRHADFSRLWWAQLFSITGDRFTYLALAGMLFEHSREHAGPSYAALLAMLANVVVAPVLLFAPFTGAWVDRLNLKRVLVAADVLRALIVLSIPFAYHLTGSTGSTFLLVFLLFTVNVAFLPAKSAILPEIVPNGRLLAANSLLAGAAVIATVCGALAGGYVIDRWGWDVAMCLDAATYLFSALSVATIAYDSASHRSTLPRVTPRLYVREVVDGWALVRRNPVVGAALLSLAAIWCAGGVLHVAGNQHVQLAASNPGMQRLGVLLLAIGIGSGIGTWWINTYGRLLPRVRVLACALVLAGLSFLPFAASSLFVVFVAAAFLAGMFAAPVLVLTETLLQEGTALQHRARVFSVRDFLMRGTLLASASGTAWLIAASSSGVALGVGALLLVAVGSTLLALNRRQHSILAPLDPSLATYPRSSSDTG